MVEADRCDLHEAAILIGTDESEDLLRLGRSPIGDECQRCAVCRSAREYVERRLDARGGRASAQDPSVEAAWQNLKASIERAKASIHKPA
jgi:hypothetical protein